MFLTPILPPLLDGCWVVGVPGVKTPGLVLLPLRGREPARRRIGRIGRIGPIHRTPPDEILRIDKNRGIDAKSADLRAILFHAHPPELIIAARLC